MLHRKKKDGRVLLSPVAKAAEVGRKKADIDSVIAHAVSCVIDGAVKARAPAFHDVNRRDRKDYIDDMAGEYVGRERMEIRRENEWRGRAIAEGARRSGGPGGYDVDRRGFGINPKGETGSLVAEFMGWLCAGGGDIDKAHGLSRRHRGNDTVVRALGESSFGSGGAFVPEVIASDYIELLYNAAVFLAAGPQRASVTNGNLTLPKLTTGASVTWGGESSNVGASTQGTGQVKIDLKKLGVLTASSNEFLRDSGPSAIDMIRNDLAAAASVAIDAAALRSLGTANEPRGLRGSVASGNSFTANATVNVGNVTSDIIQCFKLLEDAKMAMQNVAAFTSPRSKWYLMGARDGNNNAVWRDEILAGTLYGAKFFSTQNIPTNVGTGSVMSEFYLADMNQQIFAEETDGVRIDARDGVAYYDGSAVVSAFSRDETAVRLTQRVDFVERQGGNSIVLLSDVAWSPV